MPFDSTKLWLKDFWSGKLFRDHRQTVDGGTANPNYGKFYQVGSGYSGCFGCRCSCTDCELDPDTSIPNIIRVTWGVSAGCDCLWIGDADGTTVNLHFLDSPAFGPFYCCLQPPSYGYGAFNYGPCQKFWACTNDLSCYTDYQFIASPNDPDKPMGVNCVEYGTVMTDQLYNLQVSCLVLAYPNATTFSLDPTFGTDCSPAASPMWGGQIWVSIHSPGNSPFSQASGSVQWPDSTGEEQTCDGPPPDFTSGTFTCGAGNGIAPHPSLWNGFGVRASGCDPCLCSSTDWIIGPHNTGDSGSASLTSCNNF